ncbi:MAG: GreA/GreB family elongation factor [Gammaproteobacteria bacterium]
MVGADEFDEHEQYITVDSPLAKLLLGKKVDDDVVMQIEGKEKEFYVLNIEYED